MPHLKSCLHWVSCCELVFYWGASLLHPMKKSVVLRGKGLTPNYTIVFPSVLLMEWFLIFISLLGMSFDCDWTSCESLVVGGAAVCSSEWKLASCLSDGRTGRQTQGTHPLSVSACLSPLASFTRLILIRKPLSHRSHPW